MVTSIMLAQIQIHCDASHKGGQRDPKLGPIQANVPIVSQWGLDGPHQGPRGLKRELDEVFLCP